MCGIAGIIGAPEGEVVQRMTTAMHHRGPDDQGVWSSEHAVLGMSRLAIIDLSPAGHQPMSTPDGRYWIVYNGEVYNFQECRKMLENRGHDFFSHSDTEVILKLFQEYGPICLEYMRGMFAFAIWDTKEKTLFAARDRLGIKPFLYSVVNGCFLFASEIKAILSSGIVSREVDPAALQEYLLIGSVQPPNTIIKNVKSLLPGQYIQYHDGHLKIDTYWDIGHEPFEYFQGSYEDAKDQLSHLLEQCVVEQMVSDVPVGAFLSGGLDSTAVVSLMSVGAPGRIKTFTIGFETSDALLDESAEADLTSQYYNTDHKTLIVSDNDVTNAINHFAWSLDQPSIDGLNTYFVSRFAGNDVTVALSGLGGDEVFAGYSRTWRILNQHPFKPNNLLAGFLKQKNAQRMLSFVPEILSRRLKVLAAQNSVLGTYSLARTVFLSDDLTGMFSASGLSPISIESLLEKNVGCNKLDLVQQTCRLDLRTFMASQLLRDMDAVAMAHSLEVRFPLIDHRVVEFGFSLPVVYKYTGSKLARSERDASSYQNGVKRIFFDAMRSNLPPGLGARRKAGFKLPYERWMRAGLRSHLDDVFLSENKDSPFSLTWRQTIYKRFQAHQISSTPIWALFIFHKWYDQMLLK